MLNLEISQQPKVVFFSPSVCCGWSHKSENSHLIIAVLTVVVAQLVERSLPIPEVISKIYIEHLFTVNCVEKTKINKKRLGMAYFFLKKNNLFFTQLTDYKMHGYGESS